MSKQNLPMCLQSHQRRGGQCGQMVSCCQSESIWVNQGQLEVNPGQLEVHPGQYQLNRVNQSQSWSVWDNQGQSESTGVNRSLTRSNVVTWGQTELVDVSECSSAEVSQLVLCTLWFFKCRCFCEKCFSRCFWITSSSQKLESNTQTRC